MRNGQGTAVVALMNVGAWRVGLSEQDNGVTEDGLLSDIASPRRRRVFCPDGLEI